MMPAFVVIDTLMERLGHRTPPNPPAREGDWGGAHVPASETLTIAVVAADEK
jgi:hypothetical protein